MMRKAGVLEQINKALGDFKEGFRADYGVGGEDARSQSYRERELRGKQREAPKMEGMAGSYPLGYRIREALKLATPEGIQARNEMNMGLSGSRARKGGQILGTVAADITQDSTRRFYWLLNALQATGEVINEAALARANPNLYGKKPVINQLTNKPLGIKADEQAIAQGIAKEIDNRVVPARGYSKNMEKGIYEQRNFEPGYVQSLAIPTGIAINTGLGLMSPFGGAEGYAAALPSDEDPSKTSNVLGEIGMKYIMGRTGNLLPYDEFVKVRPDVSEGEYRAYQAFKYDKGGDFDITDGDVTLPGGAVKYTNEGIHGPELQFLGRSLPVTTGVVPYLGALAGGVAGVRTRRPIAGGFGGGMAGLAAGNILGNLMEQERRRRNAAENTSSY